MHKVNWKKRLVQAAWLLAGIGTTVLLGAAMQQKNRKKCAGIKIEISGVEENMFIDEKDILGILNSTGTVQGKAVSDLNLRAMESEVEKNPWVKNAEMFFDNLQVLQVSIDEREPVARIFTMQGRSVYLDSAGMRLPLSDKISARVPMFTDFPSDRKIMSKPDSQLLKSVVKLGRYILADPFWMAQVAQVAINTQSGFELVPVLGNHTVTLGNADHLEEKFNRLYTFYRQAWLQKGIDYYSKLDVQFSNQVVAVKRGTARTQVDSVMVAQVLDDIPDQPAPAQNESTVIPALSPRAATAKTDTVQAGRAVVKKFKQPVKENTATETVTHINNKSNSKSLSNKGSSIIPAKKPAPETKGAKPKAVMQKQ